MRSKKLATAGFLSMRSLLELKSSAEPGTKNGRRQRLMRGASDGAVVVVVVAVVVLEDADDAHLIKELLQVAGSISGCQGHHLVKVVELAELHAVAKVDHLVGEDLLEAPVLGIVWS
jgi:hypothetical protein